MAENKKRREREREILKAAREKKDYLPINNN